jgi:hypothetical protein
MVSERIMKRQFSARTTQALTPRLGPAFPQKDFWVLFHL